MTPSLTDLADSIGRASAAETPAAPSKHEPHPVSSPSKAVDVLSVALFEAYARNCGHNPNEHYDRNAAEQWMAQALAEVGVAELIAERDRLRAFAQDVMEAWPEAAPDGFDLQDYAEKNGLLRPVEMPAPCGEDCGCTEFLSADDFPATCYRKTTLLTGNPESDANIAALSTIGESQ